MAKFQSPLLGYNNNVRHKNRAFHIQTEDSGVNHPHIITHLFMDGGRILKSVKKSYAEHVGVEGMSEIVRGLMKEQHKAMFIALRDGQFDHLVEAGPQKTETSQATIHAAPPTTREAAAPVTIDETRRPAAVSTRKESAPLAPGGAAPPVSPAPSAASAAPVVASAASVERVERVDEDVPTTTRMASSSHAADAPALTLDFDALESSGDDGSPLFRAHDLPPPPKNLFAKELGTGKYRAVEADAHKGASAQRAARQSTAPGSAAKAAAAAAPTGAAGTAPGTPSRPPSSDARYAPARPAAIFGSAPQRPPQSIFSDELLSDKSLDEVILSYLAEDLEPPRRK